MDPPLTAGAEAVGLVVILPAPLRPLAGGRAAVTLGGAPSTVREALDALRAEHPTVYGRIVSENGELRPHINLFVGHEDIRHTGGLETAVTRESRLYILPAVSGGRAKQGEGAEGRAGPA